MRKALLRPTLFLSIILFSPLITWYSPLLLRDQSTDATLTGFITDQSKAAMAEVRVDVINMDTNVHYPTKSNAEGSYTAPDLPPGTYKMELEKQGFKSIVKPDIILHVQDVIAINFTMAVGSTSESVTVEAGASPINTTDATVSTVVDRNFVQNLPLNGRSFQQLITLAPGVNLTGGTSDYGEFSVNGQRATSNYLTVDGVSGNLGAVPGALLQTGMGQSATGGTNALVSVDELQEFKILTSSFAPEYGRTPGGQIILLTRAGTNSFHGTAFEYFRNNVLDANDWFANSVGGQHPPLRFNDFGGTIGGPIVKNKTFFFFSYEGQRLRQPQFGIESVPDLASRQAAAPATQAILNAFPLPNGPELGNGQTQVSAAYSNPITSDATSFRVDHALTHSLNLFARYSYAPSDATTRAPSSGLYSLSTVQQLPHKIETITVGATYVATPRLVDEIRVNFSDSFVKTSYTLDSFGGATPPATPVLFLSPLTPQDAVGYVDLNYTGGYLRDGTDAGVEQRQINALDNVSYSFGTHQFKFGVDYLRLLPIDSGEKEDEYVFTNLAGAVAGTLSRFARVQEASVRSDDVNLSFYAHDTWRPSRRLSVTHGLRWDVNPAPHDRYANNGNYVPLLGNLATGDVSPGNPGSSLWSTKYDNLAPRLGVAYQLNQAPGRETVLHAGVGLFYDVATEEGVFVPWANGFPNLFSVNIANAVMPVSPQQAALPAVSFSNPPAGSTFIDFPKDFASPRVWQWNVSVQQSLGSPQTVTLSYVAALGRKLIYDQYHIGVSANAYNVFSLDNSATSNYQALQLQYSRRLGHSLTATGNYTWGHSLDDSSTDISALPPAVDLNPRSNWGPSDFDVRHNLSGGLSYSLPSFHGGSWFTALANGWGLDSLLTARSALPVNITKSENIGFGSYALRPDVVPNVPLYIDNPNVPGGWEINPAAFTVPTNRRGDLGRNALRGFDLVQMDLSARRSFRINDRLTLLVRGELFNVFNHPNFANPVPTIGTGTFGFATSMASSFLGGGSSYGPSSLIQTGGPRSVQLSMRLQF